MKETIDHSNCLRLAGSHIFKHPAVNPEQIQLETKSGNKTWKFIPRFEVCFFHNHEPLIRPNHSELFLRGEFILEETQATHLHIIF